METWQLQGGSNGENTPENRLACHLWEAHPAWCPERPRCELEGFQASLGFFPQVRGSPFASTCPRLCTRPESARTPPGTARESRRTTQPGLRGAAAHARGRRPARSRLPGPAAGLGFLQSAILEPSRQARDACLWFSLPPGTAAGLSARPGPGRGLLELETLAAANPLKPPGFEQSELFVLLSKQLFSK